MGNIKYVHLFSFYFFKTLIVLLGFFYAEDNFRKSLQEFNSSDVIRSCIVFFIIFLAASTSSQSYENFQSVSKKTRFLLGITAGIIAILSCGYLLSVYF
ncbi:hypothetical protein A1A1_12007 [Planococcus antarcticus DSM 14505]|uniref:Uncharacterized protein n=1 Tax=Planococcus antarcticus DSM 14505 TaxID=1185653 RepID=A0A1C7DDE0_9BACL|nr:hypothetical protein BBH88_03885 [Planococcus antarcticus DSM 14505]EIM06286.1 hypothetical protein A1A1_12007 [Planococcus antarcticus DSM 14505]